MHDQIQCNRVSVTTQGTVKLVAIRRLHCTCCIVSVALSPGVSGLRWLAQRAWGELIVPLGFSCQCHHPLLFCILFHSNCNRLQELPVYSWSMVGSVANQMREGAMFFCWASGHKNDVTGRIEAGGCQKYFQAMQWYHRPKRGPKPDMRTTCEFWNGTRLDQGPHVESPILFSKYCSDGIMILIMTSGPYSATEAT